MPSTITPTATNGAAQNRVPRRNGLESTITIDNDNFEDAHDFLIEKRDIRTLGFQIQNDGATNGLSFEIYGSIDPASTAPAFALTTWELQVNGSGNIAALNNVIFESTFYHVWILIRLKRQTASNNTTAEILTTSGTR